jgi:pimeloyl-ACP methyl ester carboxylesterase
MATILLVAGPPFGVALWTQVTARLSGHGHDVRELDLWHPLPEDPTVAGLAARVAEAARAAGPDVVVVAHGSAVVIARAAADLADIGALVLCNGPIDGLDPYTRALSVLAKQPHVFAATVLRPGPWTRWLSSSVGLRRAVVNPYVMDRDTVVAIAGPLVEDGAARLALARFLRDLAGEADRKGPNGTRTLLLWGNDDRLYPAHVADSARRLIPGIEVLEVPGGRHLHPIERPWFLADELHEWLAVERSPTPTPPDHDTNVTNSA